MTKAAAGGVLLVGCGKMGGALLDGWIEGGRDPGSVVVVEPSAAVFARATASAPAGILRYASPHEISGAYHPEIVVLAVKPQSMDEVAPNYRRFADDGAVILSIAAGRTIDYFHDALGKKAAIVRAMPNTPAAIGRGITGVIGNAYVSARHHALCEALLAAVGEVVWLTDEEQIDIVTAVSGSGPAYVFLLAEVLAAAGIRAGLPAELAQRLARVTVSGSGELLHQSAESAEQLRRNVTSPNGTTAAALAVLMAEPGLKELMEKAVAAATNRSRELAG